MTSSPFMPPARPPVLPDRGRWRITYQLCRNASLHDQEVSAASRAGAVDKLLDWAASAGETVHIVSVERVGPGMEQEKQEGGQLCDGN